MAHTDPLAARIARLSPSQRMQLDSLMRAKGLYLDEHAPTDSGGEATGGECEAADSSTDAPVRMDFSFMFFADDRLGSQRAGQYDLLLEASRFADQHDICAVWIPERHFHPFGGPYPNPSVLGAAIATVTRRVGIRAGSVVLPLHDPIRVAEEWAMVDNLSAGRVSIAFASGWHEQDFVLAPENYSNRKQIMLEGIGKVRALWCGETVRVRSVKGEPVDVCSYPRPIQKELPIWITSAGSEATFVAAGHMGAHILTGLTGQRPEDLAAKLAAYRQARREAGHSVAAGRVALMLHTYLGADDAQVKERVQQPMRTYLRTNLNLHLELAKSRKMSASLPSFARDDEEALLDYAFERYFSSGALLGSVGKCQRLVRRLAGIGVTEIACLLDFGLDDSQVLAALPGIIELREAVNRVSRANITTAL
jgi:natural product biosynthesis luciferase-like monooxygenase protein